jgi:hypothetical protein
LKPEVTVIVVNLDTREFLRKCLLSLSGQKLCEIVVVDNGSQDGSVEMVKAEFPQVKLIPLLHNIGFAAATNLGFQTSSTPFICLLNSDAYLLNQALSTLLNFMKEHPEVGAVGPKLLNPDGTLQLSAARFPTPFSFFLGAVVAGRLYRKIRPSGRFFAEYALPEEDYTRCCEVDWLKGACLMIRRSAIGESIFDEKFFFYYEEADLCYRLKSSGWKVFLVPQATVIHQGGASSSQKWGEWERTRRQLDGLEYFFTKNYGYTTAWLFKFLALVGSLVKLSLLVISLPWLWQRKKEWVVAKMRWHSASFWWALHRLSSCSYFGRKRRYAKMGGKL